MHLKNLIEMVQALLIFGIYKVFTMQNNTLMSNLAKRLNRKCLQNSLIPLKFIKAPTISKKVMVV